MVCETVSIKLKKKRRRGSDPGFSIKKALVKLNRSGLREWWAEDPRVGWV